MADTDDTTPDPLAERLAYLRSRHQQHVTANFPAPGICVNDHHRWPCHAHILGEALQAAITLGAQWRDTPQLGLTQEECADELLGEITPILLGEEAGRDDRS